MSATKQKPCYSIRFKQSGEYGELIVVIHPDNGEHSFTGADVCMRWQSSLNNGPWRFYGGRLNCRDCETVEEVLELAALVRRIFGKRPNALNFERCPAECLRALAASNLPQVVYDKRESKLVHVDLVKPKDWRAWRDDWDAYDTGDRTRGCAVGCIASDEDTARRLLTVKFTESHWRDSEERFDRWCKAGRPVKFLTGDMWEGPDVLKVGEALANIATQEKADEDERARKEAERAASAGEVSEVAA